MTSSNFRGSPGLGARSRYDRNNSKSTFADALMRDLETGTERREHVEERPPLIGLWVLPHMLEESLEELANDTSWAEGERAT